MTPAFHLASKSRQLVNRLIVKREVGNVHSLDVDQTRLEQEVLRLAAEVDGTAQVAAMLKKGRGANG